jgi:hypothetical protein
MRTGAVSTAWNQVADVLANGDEFDPDEIRYSGPQHYEAA